MCKKCGATAMVINFGAALPLMVSCADKFLSQIRHYFRRSIAPSARRPLPTTPVKDTSNKHTLSSFRLGSSVVYLSRHVNPVRFCEVNAQLFSYIGFTRTCSKAAVINMRYISLEVFFN